MANISTCLRQCAVTVLLCTFAALLGQNPSFSNTFAGFARAKDEIWIAEPPHMQNFVYEIFGMLCAMMALSYFIFRFQGLDQPPCDPKFPSLLCLILMLAGTSTAFQMGKAVAPAFENPPRTVYLVVKYAFIGSMEDFRKGFNRD